MLINLNEDILRQIIREAVKENVTYKWANMDIDYPAKGRTAKKISKDEFISNMAKVYKEHCREGDDADRFDNKKITPSKFISVISWNKNAPKRLRDDLNKIEHSEENIDTIDFTKFDYVVDAIDTITSKVLIIKKCNELNIPIISSMGAGNKINPMGFIVSDIYKTEVDPLAKAMRGILRKEGIKKLKVVYSKENPLTPKSIDPSEAELTAKRVTPGSNAFVPTACGLLIGSEVLKDLIHKEN